MSAAFAVPDYQALPPAIARPVQWRRVLDNLAILQGGDTEKVLDAAYSVGDAIGGMSDERHLRRLCSSSTGRAMIGQRPCLATALCDRDRLGAMPSDSLGHHFFRFAERHGIDSRALLESQHAMSRDFSDLDPLRQWLSDRLTVMHDLWHVLAGYDATSAGEAALMCFSLPQRANDRALPVFVLVSTVSGQIGARTAMRGIRRGISARYLVEVPFEELLGFPLEEVRRDLGIGDPYIDHGEARAEGMLIPQVGDGE